MQNENGLTLLGAKTEYFQHYDSSLLESLPRAGSRQQINIDNDRLPFAGFDLWTGFELSWLNAKGKPLVGIAEFIIPATSRYLIESFIQSIEIQLSGNASTRLGQRYYYL